MISVVSEMVEVDRIGTAVRKAIDLLTVVISSDADPEKIKQATSSIEEKQRNVERNDRADPMNELSIHFASSIEVGMTALVDWNRHASAQVKMEPCSANDAQNEEADDLLNGTDEVMEGRNEEAGDAISNNSADLNDELLADMEGTYEEDANTVDSVDDASIVANIDEEKMLKRRRKHGQMKKFCCDICGKCFKTNQNLRRHAIIHAENENDRRPAECSECGRRYASADYLKIHKLTHLDGNDPDQAVLKKPFQCVDCGKRFTQSTNLATHRRTIHNDDEEERRPFKCDACGMRFTKLGHLDTHKRTHSRDSEERQPFKCEKCGKRFSQLGDFKKHKKSQHIEDGDRPYFNCDQCEKKFTEKGVLKLHMRIHLAKDDLRKQELWCEICEKYLSTHKYIEAHKRTHLDDNDPAMAESKRPFKCEDCGKRFTHSGPLKIHKRSLHSEYAELRRPFKCDVCEKCFASNQDLQVHKRSHSANDNERLPFECDHCGRRFAAARRLRLHINRWHLAA